VSILTFAGTRRRPAAARLQAQLEGQARALEALLERTPEPRL